MSWIDALLQSITEVQSSGMPQQQQPAINFTGSGVTVTPDPTNNRVNVAISAGGGGSTQGQVTLADAVVNDNVLISSTTSIKFVGPTTACILGGLEITDPVPPVGVPFDVQFLVTPGVPVTIKNESSGSSAGNQIVTTTGGDFLLPVGGQPSARLVRTLIGGVSYYVMQSSGVEIQREIKITGFPNVDPTGTSDSAAGINAALASAAAQGLPCYAPGGTFLCNSPISVPLLSKLSGSGAQSTTFKGNHTGDVFEVLGTVNTTGIGHVTLEDFRITSTHIDVGNGNVAGATNASPISVTVTGHGLSTGAFVYIQGVGGNTGANNAWQVTVVDANHFTLNGSTGSGAYTSGGTCVQVNRCGVHELALAFDAHRKLEIDGCFFGRVWDQSEVCSSKDVTLTGNLIAQEYFTEGSDFTPGASPGFTNNIVSINTTWNGGRVGIVDDGGQSHWFVGGTLNGQSDWSARIAGVENATFDSIDVESSDFLFQEDTYLGGNVTGTATSTVIRACGFGNGGSHHSINIAQAGSISIQACRLASGLTQIVGGPNVSRLDIDTMTSFAGTLIDGLPSNWGTTAVQATVLSSSSGTFTPQGTTRKLRIRGVGGGGAGGGCTSVAVAAGAAGGGGAGAYLEVLVPVLPGTAYSYTCGAGGAGASGAGGGNGGNSTFVIGGTTYTCPGGGGAAVATASSSLTTNPGGAGGAVATNGTLNTTGDPGAYGLILVVTGAVGASGDGASSELGAGGLGLTSPATGNAGTGYGSGGGGALAGASTTEAGGNGAGGCWVVEEFA